MQLCIYEDTRDITPLCCISRPRLPFPGQSSRLCARAQGTELRWLHRTAEEVVATRPLSATAGPHQPLAVCNDAVCCYNCRADGLQDFVYCCVTTEGLQDRQRHPVSQLSNSQECQLYGTSRQHTL